MDVEDVQVSRYLEGRLVWKTSMWKTYRCGGKRCGCATSLVDKVEVLELEDDNVGDIEEDDALPEEAVADVGDVGGRASCRRGGT